MATLFEMPKLGMDMEEGSVVRWLKKEQEAVKKGEALAEIETDKSSVEVESPADGIVLKIYHPEGESLPVGTVIAAIGQAGETVDAVPGGGGETGAPAPTPEAAPAPAAAPAGVTFFEMPKLGMDMDEGAVARWLKKENDPVKKGEALAEIETDKSTVEVESPADGVLLKIYTAEGDSVPVTTVIAAIGPAGTPVPERAGSQPSVRQPAAEPAVLPSAPAEAAAAVPAAAAVNRRGKLRVSPRARKLAEKNGVDLSLIQGTGPSGRIVEKDVRGFLARPVSAVPAPASGPDYDLIPLTTMRKTIARRMLQSTTTIPSFALEIEVDMRQAISLRETMKKKDVKISFHDLFAKCAACAMKQHPLLNAAYCDDGIHQYHSVNIGVAVAIDGGLVVPVIRDVERKSVTEISADGKALIEKARAGKLGPADMTGGHMTISNLGMYPLKSFSAIINPGESCILAAAGLRQVPAIENGQLVELPKMSITATFDHRLIDGAAGAEFLKTLKEYIENPAMMVM